MMMVLCSLLTHPDAGYVMKPQPRVSITKRVLKGFPQKEIKELINNSLTAGKGEPACESLCEA